MLIAARKAPGECFWATIDRPAAYITASMKHFSTAGPQITPVVHPHGPESASETALRNAAVQQPAHVDTNKAGGEPPKYTQRMQGAPSAPLSRATGCVWLTLELLMALPLHWRQRHLLEHWRLCKGMASMPRLSRSNYLHPVRAVGPTCRSDRLSKAGSGWLFHSAACCSGANAPKLSI